jgi:PKD repeat protein
MNSITSFKLDSKVVISMLLLSTIFLGLMAFKYTTKEKCGVVNFSFRTANKNDIVYTSEKVYFSSELKYSAESWEWDFGDKQKIDSKSGPYVAHTYQDAGQYTVRLIINKNCEFARTINVNKRDDINKKLFPLPLWPAEPLYVGREYNFGDETVGAVTWSWYFDKQPKYLQQNITRVFTEPGKHTVTLVLNDNWEFNRIEKVFYVKPADVKYSPIVPQTIPQGGDPGRKKIDENINGEGNNELNQNKKIGDKLPGKSLDELADEAKKIPTISDQVLTGLVSGINGAGYNELKKYFKNNNYGNCTFLFNGRNITIDQLKENVQKHNEYGESIDVKQSTNSDNKIIQLTITAKLKPKSRWIGKDKNREYPY